MGSLIFCKKYVNTLKIFYIYMCDFKNKSTNYPNYIIFYIHIFKFSYHLWLVISPLMTALSVFKNAYKES